MTDPDQVQSSHGDGGSQGVGTHHTDRLLALADSAWENLHLEPPIDLSTVCRHLHIRIHKKPMEPDICGLYVVTPKGRRVIRVNTLLQPVRRRFTLAHEIGHHLLLPANPEPGTVCQLMAYYHGPKPAIERRCDRFAAALLMPHGLFRLWWTDMRHNPTGRIAVLADRFGTSATAVRGRARELGLVEWRGTGEY